MDVNRFLESVILEGISPQLMAPAQQGANMDAVQSAQQMIQ